MIYLVLFQRELVEQILTNEMSTDGREYLKKIVQVGFDVPHMQRSQLERILFRRLDALLQDETVQKLWDKERWPEVFLPGLRRYFETLRDVYRFASAISVHFAIFSRKDTFEVNPIDLIALEVLRVFEPEVYKALPSSKDTLTRTEDFRSSRARAETAEKDEIKAIVQSTCEAHQKSVEEILTQIFPTIAWVFGGSRYPSHHLDRWYRQRRACHPDVFDKYFQLTISEGDLSHEQVEAIVSLAGDRSALVDMLRSLHEKNLLDVAIDRLSSYKETINLDNAVPFITAIFDVCDGLPIGRNGLLEVSTEIHIVRIVHWYLKRESTIQNRHDILAGAIRQTTGVYLPCFVVALEADKAKESQQDQDRLTDDAGIKHLQELCISKIRLAATDGTLATHLRLGHLLAFWQ